jgi:hypothetical protein
MNPAPRGYSLPTTRNGKDIVMHSVLFAENEENKCFIFVAYASEEEKALLMKFVDYCKKNFIMPTVSRENYPQTFTGILVNAIRASLKKALGMEIDAPKSVQANRS